MSKTSKATFDWNDVERIFHDAVHLPHDARCTFLHHECRGNSKLREEVESLLAAHEEAEERFIAPFDFGSLDLPELRSTESVRVELTQLTEYDATSELTQRPVSLRQSPIRDNPIGKTMSRYLVERWLGAGGMGEVFLVRDKVTGRELALKRIRRENLRDPGQGSGAAVTGSRADPTAESVLLLKQEFRSMAKLRHPNIVDVEGFGVLDDGSHYITMEILPGEGLREILQRRTLALSEVYHILIQLCQVLGFIHSRNLVHKDLKPENIRITLDGNIKLMDFGLMQPMGESGSDRISGTPAYMSPEVIQGKEIDGRCDLYSLGILAYELTTGKLPFLGSSITEVFTNHLEVEPRPVSEHRPEVPMEFERVILKLLAKEPRARFQSTSEVIRELARVSGEKHAEQTIEQKKSYLNCADLVGRDREIAELDAALARTRRGSGGCVFVAAPAGTGKSRVLQEFRLKVQLSRTPFLMAQCVEGGRSTYGPMVDVLRSLIPISRKESLDRHGNALARILPDVKTKGYFEEPPLDPVNEKLRIFEHVTRWIEEIVGDGPLVICLEDVHSADHATLELFSYCVNETASLPVLFLASFRDDQMSSDSPVFRLVADGAARLIRLSPFDPAQVELLLAGMLGKVSLAAEFVGQIYNATGGNPYFVCETMRSLVEDGILQLDYGTWHIPRDFRRLPLPSSIEETISKRLGFLGAESLMAIRAMSITAKPIDLSTLRHLTGLEEESLFDVVDDLLERQFLRKIDRRYTFTQDRVRETVYELLQSEERTRAHSRMAEIIERRYEGNLEVVSEELAWHYGHTGDRAKSITFMVMAGKEACKKQVWVTGVQWLERAVDLLDQEHDFPDRRWVLLECLELITRHSYFMNNRLCAKASERFVRELGSVVRLEPFVVALKLLYGLSSLFPERLKEALKARLHRPPRPFPVGKGKFRTFLARHDYASAYLRVLTARSFHIASLPLIGEYTRPESLVEANLRYVPDRRSLIQAIVLFPHLAVRTHQGIGMYDSILEDTEVALSLFKKNEPFLNRQLWWVYSYVIFIRLAHYCWRGDDDYPRELYTHWAEIIEANGLVESYVLYHYVPAVVAFFHGRHKELEKHRGKMDTYFKRLGWPVYYRIWLYLWDIRLMIQLGRFREALRLYSEWRQVADQNLDVVNDIWNRSYVELFHGQAWLAMGEAEKAIRTMESALSLASRHGLESITACLAGLATALIEAGRVAQARERARECHSRAHSREYGNPYWQIVSNRVLGILAVRQADFDRGRTLLTQSRQLAARMGNPIEEGLTCLELSKLEKNLGNLPASRQFAGAARTLFEDIENSYLIDRASALLQVL